MIVPLTGRQWNALAQRIPVEWKQAMKLHRTQNYGRSHNYDLPAACWRAVFDHVSSRALGPNGGFTQGPDALYSCLSLIMRRLMLVEQHPALTPGLCVTGVNTDVIPAWETRPTRSCYPAEAPFVLLVPYHFVERGWQLTTWMSAQDGGQPERLLHRYEMETGLIAEFRAVAVEL